jgi:hypothetical protein
MIEINSVTVVLGLELLVALIALLGFLLWRGRSKQQRDRQCAGALVARINTKQTDRISQLEGKLFGAAAQLPAELRQQSLAAVAVKENELYRHVIRAFLDRDTQKLGELDQYVQKLSEPYCQLIAGLIGQAAGEGMVSRDDYAALDARLADAEARAREAEAKAERINYQLTVALNTLDDVSSEYTKMFNEPKSMEELHASRKRVLAAFRRSEQQAWEGILPELSSPESRKLP